jgi:hypothetical protein
MATTSRRPRRRYGCAISVAVLVAVVTLFWSAGGFYGLLHVMRGRNPWAYVSPTRERREETIARAELIIAALERWKACHGAYPQTLDELVPAELPVLPRSTIGDRRWNYRRPQPDRFVLDFFEGAIYEHSWWDSSVGRWDGDH